MDKEIARWAVEKIGYEGIHIRMQERVMEHLSPDWNHVHALLRSMFKGVTVERNEYNHCKTQQERVEIYIFSKETLLFDSDIENTPTAIISALYEWEKENN